MTCLCEGRASIELEGGREGGKKERREKFMEGTDNKEGGREGGRANLEEEHGASGAAGESFHVAVPHHH